MPRQPRIQYEGAFYHVLARGDRGEPIVTDDADCAIFLRTLEEACEKTGWLVHAWVLMKNHYHLLIETPQANLVDGMKWMQNAYTRRFNVRHQGWGHIFGGRYKAVVVQPDSGPYLRVLIDYIHLNPVRAGLVGMGRPGRGLLDYFWSSLAQAYAVMPKKRPHWMQVERGLGVWHLEDTATGRQRYLERLEEKCRQEEAGRCGVAEVDGQGLHSTLRRGWYWGDQAFREFLLKKITPGLERLNDRTYRSSSLAQSHDEFAAQKLLRAGLAYYGLSEEDLKKTKGTHPAKVAMAWMLHTQTTVPQRWIANELHMRSAANVSQQIRRLSPAYAAQWRTVLEELRAAPQVD